MSRRVPRVGEVAAAYRPKFAHELRNEWAIALLYRPCSLVLTPLFARCGASPLGVTLLALACALALPWLALGTGGAWASVGGVAVAFCVLDCVDGDLARVTGRESRRGAYADFVTDLIYRVTLYAAIGLMAARSTDSPFAAPSAGLAAGLACALLAIVARACRLHAEGSPASRAPAAGAAKDTPGSIAIAFLGGLDHLLPIGVLACGAAGRLDWLLAWLFVYSLGDFVLTQFDAWGRLR